MFLLHPSQLPARATRRDLVRACSWFGSWRRSFAAVPQSSLASLTKSCNLQIYQSLSTDPFVNLAIERFLFLNSAPDAKILFLYVNRPCVVIGRNQNPWLEANERLLIEKFQNYGSADLGRDFLIRRQSGGGAVFHDEGNLNYSVICPRAIFHRDKHAEMVVRALKSVGAVNSMVNERHDIVLAQESDQPANVVRAKSDDPESPPVEMTPKALKISGSAYKLTGQRAMHHGTCLIDSPNLTRLGSFLRSPARPYLRARGVESVRSPVGNVSSVIPTVQGSYLIQQVVSQIMEEFAKLYGMDSKAVQLAQRAHLNSDDLQLYTDDYSTVGAINESFMESDPLFFRKEIKTMKSSKWKYEQSPQFTFSTYPTKDDDRPRPPILPEILGPSVCFV